MSSPKPSPEEFSLAEAQVGADLDREMQIGAAEAFPDKPAAPGGPWGKARFVMARCGWMAGKYPWQTVACLLGAVGCGALCTYFGWSVLAGLVLYAASAED